MNDVVLHDGRLLDGAGNPAFHGDIAIREGRIVEIGHRLGVQGRINLDLNGLTVSPGFIDMHTHSDLAILAEPAHEPKIRQGVTLDVIGQDGLGYAPVTSASRAWVAELMRDWNGEGDGGQPGWESIDAYFEDLDRRIAVNVAYLAPHGTIRLAAMGMDERSPTEGELKKMRRLTAECMAAGAVGLSTGLQYIPAMYASDEELISLCEIVAEWGGYFAPHHRNYGRDALRAYADCIEIARRSGVALHLTHAHLAYEVNEGRAGELLGLIDEARASGLEVTLDTYPYVTGNPYLRIFLPARVMSGGPDAAAERLTDVGERARLREELEGEGFEGVPVDWSRIEVSSVREPANRRWLGKSIAQSAAEAGVSEIDFYCDLLIADRLGTKCLEHIGSEGNVQSIMRHVAHMAGSDGILVGDRPHPRGWGTFPRYLGHYVRELGVLTWENAIRKLTSLPAQRLGFYDRGLLRPGFAADIVCFNPERINETGTFANPRNYPIGIHYVLVNGEVVLDDGVHTGARAGRALRRRAPASGRKRTP